MAVRGELGGWRSRTTFVLALSASTVGLGNLWRFAYLMGESGGGLFILAYLLSLFFVAVPVMIAEVIIGSHGRAGPVEALRWSADRSLRSRSWIGLGVLACLTGLLILSYYVVVAGWSLAYAWFSHQGAFAAASAPLVAEQFNDLLRDPSQMMYWQTLFLLSAIAIVALGVRRGLGLLVWLSVPCMFALLVALIQFSFETGDVAATQDFMFSTQSMDFGWNAALIALGQALLTLGVGVGVGISFGAYAPPRLPIGRSVVAVAVFDTAIAIMAGLAIFPLVFANNMTPAMGPGLMFVSLPYAFGNILLGELFGTVFFTLVVLAALGSVVAIMEPIVTVLMQRFRIGRLLSTVLVGTVVWLLSILVSLSLMPGTAEDYLANGRLFQLVDGVTANILLPLMALLIAIFVGWRVRPEILRRELERERAVFFVLWQIVLRYVAPPAIVIMMLAAIW